MTVRQAERAAAEGPRTQLQRRPEARGPLAHGSLAGGAAGRAEWVSAEVLAGMLALFYLVGRWGLSRITPMMQDQEDLVDLSQPCWWIAGALSLLVLLTGHRGGARGPQLRTRRRIRRMTGLIVMFLSYALLSALWSPDYDLAISKMTEVGLLLVIVICSSVLFSNSDMRRVNDSFWRWITLTTGLLGLVGVASLVASSSGRLAVLGGGPNVFGRNMGLLWLGCLFAGQRGRWIPAWVGVAVVAWCLAVSTGSRGATLASVSALLAVTVLTKARWTRKVQIGAALAVVAAFVVQFTSLGAATLRVFQSRFVQLTMESQYTSFRDRLARDAIRAGLENPIVGRGLNSFSSATLIGHGGEYPHNIVLEAFAEGGLIGVGLLLLVFAYPAYLVLMRRVRMAPWNVGAAVLLLVAAQFSGDIFDARGIFIVLLLAVASSPPATPMRPLGRPLGAAIIDTQGRRGT